MKISNMHRAVDPAFWCGKSVFLTGHTGFKGSWLSLWLAQMGARVHGYALEPDTNPSMFNALGLADLTASNHIADIRDTKTLFKAVAKSEPDVVIHMAAQPIVSYGYKKPFETFEVNVIGTVALLEACRNLADDVPVLVVSSDKCYLNLDQGRAFSEDDPLGGKDPYSASKAATELVVIAWRQSFFGSNGPRLSSGRAGNVVGGGDWSIDRLVPDIVRAFSSGAPALIRNPRAVRPWQHVMEPLAGYLVAIQAAAESRTLARSWNFGPRAGDDARVADVVELAKKAWGPNVTHEISSAEQDWVEAKALGLDCTLAETELGWRPVFDLTETIERTIQWYRVFYDGHTSDDMRQFTSAQIKAYSKAATT